MTAIDATATARVTKAGKFFKRRFVLELLINDKPTGLWWTLSRKQTKTMPKILVDNAAEILNHYGLMDAAFNTVADAAPTATATAEPVLVGAGAPAPDTSDWPKSFSRGVMPSKGQRVALASSIGHFPKGLVGTVTRVDPWLETVKDENQFPVRVALTHGADTLEIPLHLHEIEVVR